MSIFDTLGVTKRIYSAAPTSAPYGIALDKNSVPGKTKIWYATPSIAFFILQNYIKLHKIKQRN